MSAILAALLAQIGPWLIGAVSVVGALFFTHRTGVKKGEDSANAKNAIENAEAEKARTAEEVKHTTEVQQNAIENSNRVSRLDDTAVDNELRGKWGD